jgi:hypothetical protein
MRRTRSVPGGLAMRDAAASAINTAPRRRSSRQPTPLGRGRCFRSGRFGGVSAGGVIAAAFSRARRLRFADLTASDSRSAESGGSACCPLPSSPTARRRLEQRLT